MQEGSSGGDEAARWAKDVFAITLFVDDLAEAASFYRRVFEMPVVGEDESSVAFRFPNVLVTLVAVSSAPELIEPASVGERGTPARMMLTLRVGNVDAACERIRALGLRLLNGPIDRPWGPRTAAFADPSGHCWELSD